MRHIELGNAAHEQYDLAIKALDNARKSDDVRSWQNYLEEAKARVGVARLAMELRDVPDTRAVRE